MPDGFSVTALDLGGGGGHAQFDRPKAERMRHVAILAQRSAHCWAATRSAVDQGVGEFEALYPVVAGPDWGFWWD